MTQNSKQRDERLRAGRPRDLLSLMSASSSELLEELAQAADGSHDESGVPPRALQLADMLVAEIVRLIRLGTRAQLSRAAEGFADAVVDPSAERLKQSAPEAHTMLMGSASVLAAAVAPSSSGGEIAVLHSWRGKARKALRLVAREREQMLPRAELRKALKETDGSSIEDSLLSHILGDLEAAGLIQRMKNGREVNVHLGPTAYTERVQQILGQIDDDVEIAERAVRRVLEAAIADMDWEADLVSGDAGSQLANLRKRARRFRREAASADVSVARIIGDARLAIVVVRVAGRPLGGSALLESFNDELLWAVSLQDGQLVELTALARADDWFSDHPSSGPRRSAWERLSRRGDPHSGTELRRLSWVRFLSRAEEVGMIVDSSTGEFLYTEHVRDWLPGSSEQAASLAEGAGVTNIEKPPPRYGSGDWALEFRREPETAPTELQSLR